MDRPPQTTIKQQGACCMTTDKHLLLIGSQYPQNFKTELLHTAEELGMKVIPADIGSFESGERYCELYPGLRDKFAENQKEIAGAIVHIVLSMQDDPNLLMVDAINIAETVTEYGGIPYMDLTFSPFARQDRRFDNRMVSVMGKTFPKHLHAAGVKHVTTFDMHSKASEKFYTDYFGENVLFLSALEEIYKTIKQVVGNDTAVKYAAPDGFDKPNDIAQAKARQLTRMDFGDNCDLSEHMLGLKKIHTGPSTVEVTKAAGDSEGTDVVLIDDMGDTLSTLKKAANVTKEDGARTTTAAFTHALLSGNSLDIMTQETIDEQPNPIDRFIVMDSILSVYDKVSALPEEQQARIRVISMLPLIKQALTLTA
jgi:ribose-phosphate pyrophosphokinase